MRNGQNLRMDHHSIGTSFPSEVSSGVDSSLVVWDLNRASVKQTTRTKDRHWTRREFTDLLQLTKRPTPSPSQPDSTCPLCILEVGCGVGNFILPLMEDEVVAMGDGGEPTEDSQASASEDQTDSSLSTPYSDKNSSYDSGTANPIGETDFRYHFATPRVYACDISERAVRMFRERADASGVPCCAFVCDVTRPDALEQALRGAAPPQEVDVSPDQPRFDLVTLIFVLSALEPSAMPVCLRNIANVLKPGGRLLFRDYGQHDHSQLRFGRSTRLFPDRPSYARQDGTLSYFFSVDELTRMFNEAGLVTSHCDYVYKQTTNVAEHLAVRRVFVQAVACKPV